MFTLRIMGGLLAAAALAACSQADPTPAASGSGDRTAKLHAAAECLRQHGINNFADPVLSANGQVFTDARPLQDAENGGEAAVNACQQELSAASWNPDQQPPAPAALVEAGVKGAQCLREHGLTNFKDPTADTPYTPGHGFGMSAEDLPPGADKFTPAVQQAMTACRGLLDAEIAASKLEALAGK